jgi:iron complex outermembrane receptor protein
MTLLLASGAAFAQSNAQSNDLGSVEVTGGRGGALPVSAPDAVGSKAPPGSAPALAPSQGSLKAFQPGSIVSDKVIKDVIAQSSDYNETVKYTPGWVSNNVNGLLGDAKGGWRGFVDGQYNITFDGIPFGDANDPTHHSAAYFPSYFLGSVVADRGPGAASQIGYATFGGTLSLRSTEFADSMGGNVTTGYGSFNTLSVGSTFQSGLTLDGTTRAYVQFSHGNTDGALSLGSYVQNQFQGKVERSFGDFKVTLFANYGLEDYNNVTSITYAQWQTYGKRYGAVNMNPKSQQYVDYNDSRKQTDMEYLAIEGDTHGIHIDNKLYTYSYWYPSLQNNGADQTIEGNATTANGGTITSVSVPTITGGKTKVAIKGVTSGDVTGYIKYNNYRAYGDILKASYDLDAGMASGTIRTGIWVERVDNSRLQEYIDYTTGQTYPSLGNSIQASYKLNLNSHITNIQPFVEYDWRPVQHLTITPGFKFESFTRDHIASVNQTTLQPIDYSHTYTAGLPFLAARYELTPEVTVYAQASKGFLAPTVSAFYVFDPSVGGIQPQTTTNYQAGAVYKSEKITASFDIYRIDADNFPITTSLPTGQQIYQNAGTARYQGVETEGSYSLFNGFSAFASGALMQSKFISGAKNGLRAPDAPDFTVAGGLIYDDGFAFGALLQKFTGGFYGSSGQSATTATTNGALNFVKAYNTTDLVVGFRTSKLHDLGIGNSLKVKLGVYNILDHRNISEISGKTDGLTSINNSTLTYSFLPGRTIMGSVGIDF